MKCKMTILVVLLYSLLFAEFQGEEKSQMISHRGQPQQSLINLGNVSSWVLWNGISGHNPFGGSGTTFPRSTAQTIYQEGIIWGCYVNDGEQPKLRVGGQTYNCGTVPGRILPNGTPANPTDPDVRIYRIRHDYLTMTDDEVKKDAAEINNIDIGSVTTAQMNEIRNQYATDYIEWPVSQGAPWEDINNNGIYEPTTDKPGVPNAEQVLWFAINDFDISATTNLYGSPPIGLEVQITLWSYDGADPVNNATYRRYRLINKSGVKLDSMFISQWSDPDIGEAGNDFAGCDPSINLMYGYNAESTDSDYQTFSINPPAYGYSLIQGPIVPSPGDLAWFDFREKTGYKNLEMTSFAYFAAGSSIPDPELHLYDGTLAWYVMQNGYIPNEDTTFLNHYTHGSGPNTGQPTRFPLSGNPMTNTGDVDGKGTNLSMGDRRIVLNTGSFTMMPGDTQEVIICAAGGWLYGSDHRQNVQNLRNSFPELRNVVYGTQNYPVLPILSQLDCTSDPHHSHLLIQLEDQGLATYSDVNIELIPSNSSASNIIIPLYDDGLHNDGTANDGLWGADTLFNNKKYRYNTKTNIISGGQLHEKYFSSTLRLRPIPKIHNFQILWENALQDGFINHNERVHVGFSITNQDSVNSIENFYMNLANQQISINDTIQPGQIIKITHPHLELVAPSNGDSLTISAWLSFDFHFTPLSVSIPLYPWTPSPFWRDTLEVNSPNSSNLNGVLPIVTDESQMTGHAYQITMSYNYDSTEVKYWHLKDLDLNTIVFDSALIGEDPELDYQIVDGIEWKVFSPPPGFKAIVEIANGNGSLPPDQWDNAGTPFQGNDVWHSLSAPADPNRFYVSGGGGGGTIDRLEKYIEYAASRDFEIRFTNNTNYGIFAFTDEKIATTPFEIWDIGIDTPDDPSDDVRMIPFFNEEINTSANWGWATGTDPYFGYPSSDWIYFMDPEPGTNGYQDFANACINSGGPGTTFNTNLPGASNYFVNLYGGLVYPIGRVIFGDYGGNGTAPEPGTIIRFITNKVFAVTDTIYLPGHFTNSKNENIPQDYRIYQNYPNPFNPETNIRFALPQFEKVELTVFNILGQKIKTLVNQNMAPGMHDIRWDGKNSAGNKVSSGIYFYRIKAGDFEQHKKMILMK